MPSDYNDVNVVKGPLGKPGSAEHTKFISDVWQRYNWYYMQTLPIWEVVDRMWKLYQCKGDDPRSADEMWRANIQPPLGYSNIESMTANVVSILTSADPMIQPEAVNDADMEKAKSVERLIDYTYRQNSYVKLLTKQARAKFVQGTDFFKLTWGEKAHVIQVNPKPGEAERLQEAIQQAVGAGAPNPPDWMTQPEAFEQWRKMVKTAGKGSVPEPPYGGPRTVVNYRGPLFTRLPMWSVILDPLIDEMEDQNFIVHRTVKSRHWLEERTKAGHYNQEAVDFGMANWDGRRILEWESSYYEQRGLTINTDPAYYDSVELLEVWQPGTPVPYALVLNRKAVINKDPYSMPYEHGMCAIGAVRNIVLPGQFHGMSALQPIESLMDELRKLRNLRADGATLNVLPVWVKLKEAGIPDLIRKLRPGGVVSVSRPDALQALKKDPMPGEAWQEPAEIRMEVADAMQVYDSSKGAPAQVGRVTGTEYQGRSSQAQQRAKLDALNMEADLIPSVRQCLSLWKQLGNPELRENVAGQPDPFADLTSSDLTEAVQWAYRFRGATKAIDRNMQAQQLMLAADKFGAVMLPQELRFLAREFFETLDIRGGSRIITEEGTQEKQQDYELQRQASLTQIQMQTAQMQAGMAPATGQPAQPQPEAPPEGGNPSEQPPTQG